MKDLTLKEIQNLKEHAHKVLQETYKHRKIELENDKYHFVDHIGIALTRLTEINELYEKKIKEEEIKTNRINNIKNEILKKQNEINSLNKELSQLIQGDIK